MLADPHINSASSRSTSSSLLDGDRTGGITTHSSSSWPLRSAAATASNPLWLSSFLFTWPPGQASGEGISPAPTVLDLPAAEQAFTQWLATTNKVLKDLPNCPDDDFHPGIDNLSEWLLKLFRPSPPAGLSTYTAQEQRDLVEGHVQVMQRLQHLQALLFNLDKAAAKHGNQLRAATARLEAAATEGTRLKAISDSCTADARSRAGQLLQAAAELKVAQDRVAELEVSLQRLSQEAAAAQALVRHASSNKEALERSLEAASAGEVLKLKALRGACKAAQEEQAALLAMDLEGQLAHHQRLYTAQGQELEAAAQRLEAAPQQQQEAVAAAEQAAAAGRQRVEADVATLQERLSSQQAQLERIRSSLAATDAEYGGLLAQVAQVQLERDAAAAAASSAANTTQTSLQERLSEVEGSNQQLAADTAAALERKATAARSQDKAKLRLAALEEQMAHQREERERLSADIQASRTSTQAFEKAVDDKRVELAAAELDKASAVSAHQEARHKLEAAQRVLDGKKEAKARLVQERKALNARLQDAQQVDREHQRAQHQLAGMPALLGQLEAIEVSNEEQGQQVAQGQEEVKAAQAGAKEVELRIAALDRAIGELKAQVREQQAAVDAKKEEADATVKVEEQRHGELKVLATQLDAQYHLIDSTTEARLVADITLRHARLEAAAGKEAALQQVLHQLQPDVRKGSQAMHSKQEVLAAQQAQIAAVEQQVAQKRQANAHRSQQTEVADGRVEAMQRQVDARKEKGKELAAGLDQGTRQRTQLHEKQQELMQELGAGKDT